MSDKIKVQISFTAQIETGATIEMTREEYNEWCERIDNARGYEQQRVAEDLMSKADVDFFPHGDISRVEVEDFCEVKPKK